MRIYHALREIWHLAPLRTTAPYFRGEFVLVASTHDFGPSLPTHERT